jgi:hypothetical protein
MNTQVFSIMLVLLSFTLAYPQSAGNALFRRAECASDDFCLVKRMDGPIRKKPKTAAATAKPKPTPIWDTVPRPQALSLSNAITEKAAVEARDAYNGFAKDTKRSTIEAHIREKEQVIDTRVPTDPIRMEAISGLYIDIQKLAEYKSLFLAMEVANQANVEVYQLDLHGYRPENVAEAIKKRLNQNVFPSLEVITGVGKHTHANAMRGKVNPVTADSLSYLDRPAVKAIFKYQKTPIVGGLNRGSFTITPA